MRYEYKVIPAPTKGQRSKGVKTAEGKFAYMLEQVLNEMGAEGWEFQRAETLPSEERAGLTSKTTVFRNVLVFRRTVDTDVSAFAPQVIAAPTPIAVQPTETAEREEPPLESPQDDTAAEPDAADDRSDGSKKTS